MKKQTKSQTAAPFMAAADPAAEPPWDRVIRPRRGLLAVPWRELWRYRDLVGLFALRDTLVQHKQTVLGPLWFVIQPLLATLVFSFLFGRLAGLGTQGVPHFLFYMAGLACWNYFADCVQKSAHTFTRNAQLFGKVYFPRLAIPVAAVGGSLVTFAVQFAIFLGGLAFYLAKARYFPDPLHPIYLSLNWHAWLLPLLVVQLTMLGLGVGLIVSALTIKYRDLALGLGFGLQLWMYASSVVFPLAKVKEPLLRQLLALNPVVPIIEAMRFGFLGKGTVFFPQFACSFAVSVLLLAIGVVMFNRAEQTAMDEV